MLWHQKSSIAHFLLQLLTWNITLFSQVLWNLHWEIVFICEQCPLRLRLSAIVKFLLGATPTHTIRTMYLAPLFHHLFLSLTLYYNCFLLHHLKKLPYTQAAICRGKLLRSKHIHKSLDYISNTGDKYFILILAFILLSCLSCPHVSQKKLKMEAMQGACTQFQKKLLESSSRDRCRIIGHCCRTCVPPEQEQRRGVLLSLGRMKEMKMKDASALFLLGLWQKSTFWGSGTQQLPMKSARDCTAAGCVKHMVRCWAADLYFPM